MQPKKFYTHEFKIQALRMVDQGKNVTEVALHFGIDRCTLYRWHTKALAGKFPGFQPTRENAVETQRTFLTEFKIERVREIEAGKTISQVARETGVRRTVMQEWYDKFRNPSLDPVHLGKAEAEQIVQTVRAEDAKIEKATVQAERRREDEIRRTEDRVHRMTRDPLIWLQKYTETRDSHWREQGANSPYRPFPDYPYFRPLMDGFIGDQHVFIGKSRNMMLSWLCVGFFTHAAMTTKGIDILFQSQKEDKAFELVDYAKTLYDCQYPELQEAFPLAKKLKNMADGELLFENGSRILGIPGGADQIRSYHPWGLLMDEAAFMPEAGDSYNNALPVCKKIIVLSSAGPGWFADTIRDTVAQPSSSS